MISKEIQELRDEFKKQTTLPHSRPYQGHTQYYAEWLEIKLSEKQNNWISVDDKLPEIILDEHDMVINNVLVCSEKGNVQIQLSSQLHDTMKEGSFYYKIFTHWQPLPGAPL